MTNAQKQLGLRIPADQYNKLKDYARVNNISLTELIITIFSNFLTNSTPGLCIECKTQNPPESKFCNNCGYPLTDDAIKATDDLKWALYSDPKATLDLIEEYGGIEELEKKKIVSPEQLALITILKLQQEVEVLKNQMSDLQKKN